MVAPIDHSDVDRRVGEVPDRQQPAETRTDDDHPVPGRLLDHGYRPGLECMMPPSAKIVVAVR